MYSGGFFPFETPEEYWAYWSRYIFINRYMNAPKPVYETLLSLVRDKDCFVLTTNVDHCFQKAGFDKSDCFTPKGTTACSNAASPAAARPFDNEAAICEMVKRQNDMKIPTELIPTCPRCGRPVTMNLRCDDRFAEDEGWHNAAERYESFYSHPQGAKNSFGSSSGLQHPDNYKISFWRMTAENSRATYACINNGEAACPDIIKDRSICINSDIYDVISKLK